MGTARRIGARMTVSIGVAMLVDGDGRAGVDARRRRRAVYAIHDTTALIMGGTTGPTPDEPHRRGCQEPVHRADPSGPGHRVRRGDDTRGVVAHHRALPPRSGSRSGTAEHLRDLVAQRGRTSRGGNSRDSSTSPSNQSVAGRGRRSGGGDGRARQRPSGDLPASRRARRVANRGEAQARRAVPGGNQSPRYRLRVGR